MLTFRFCPLLRVCSLAIITGSHNHFFLNVLLATLQLITWPQVFVKQNRIRLLLSGNIFLGLIHCTIATKLVGENGLKERGTDLLAVLAATLALVICPVIVSIWLLTMCSLGRDGVGGRKSMGRGRGGERRGTRDRREGALGITNLLAVLAATLALVICPVIVSIWLLTMCSFDSAAFNLFPPISMICLCSWWTSSSTSA